MNRFGYGRQLFVVTVLLAIFIAEVQENIREKFKMNQLVNY